MCFIHLNNFKYEILEKVIDYFPAMHEGLCFHVYNKTVNKEILFKEDSDRRFFMEKYELYIHPYVHTYAYCLMGNHFHFVITVKSVNEILAVILNVPKDKRVTAQKNFLAMEEDKREVNEVMHRQFNRLFTSYATRFNNKYDRKGALFIKPFKRPEIEDDNYFLRSIYYVHANPRKHGLLHDFTKYYWSSYRAYISNRPTLIKKETVLNWLGGIIEFLAFHGIDHNFDDMEDLLPE